MKKRNKAANAAYSDIKTARRQENERLSDKAVLVTALAVLYAILLLFLQNMGLSSATALGATTFIQILFWGSIAGAIFFAVWSAYRECRGMLLYSGVFLFVLWSVTVILYGGNWNHSFALVYVSLLIAVVLLHIGVRLLMSGKRKAVVPFAIVCAVIFVLLTLVAIGLRFGYIARLINLIR